MWRWFAAALLAAGVGSAAPSAAQQAPLPSLALRYPTDSDDRLSGCTLGLQCRFRLLGVIQNNGAVELRGTAFTW